MSALERVARRIGMGSVTGALGVTGWFDRVDDRHDALVVDLRAYLLTGDRTMRIQEEYRMDSEPVIGPGDVLEAWYVSAWSQRHSNIQGGHGATLRDAIIALAERIESTTEGD